MCSAAFATCCWRRSCIRPCSLYLDNAQNAVGHINENYARELLELHTLGIDSGYTQQDVQELARILTGVGVNLDSKPIRLPSAVARLLCGAGTVRVPSATA